MRVKKNFYELEEQAKEILSSPGREVERKKKTFKVEAKMTGIQDPKESYT